MFRWGTKMQGLVEKVDSLLVQGANHKQVEADEEGMLKSAIEKARRELIAAQSFFECVSEPDMVDHAIYSLQAAERKYAYLIKYAREKGYRQTWEQALREQNY
jgi:hypothetical protein